MRAFFAAAVTALAVAGGAALPAEAAPASDLRTAGAHKGASPADLRLARATYDDDDDDIRPARRLRGDSRHWKRGSHARQSYARHGTRGRLASGHHGRKLARHAVRPGHVAMKAHPLHMLPSGADIVGMASYYWQGQRTATGAWFNPDGLTAAHRTLPFGTRVRVTHMGNGRSVVVRINDRGPFIAGRIIDLSRGAAGVLGMQSQGVARVRVTVLGK